MFELQRDILAEITLRNKDNSIEITCLCSRAFVRNRETVKPSQLVELSASEEEIQFEEELSSECNSLPTILKINKHENDHEAPSCYCSASHTDNLSTDEHDSLRDAHEFSLIKGLQSSDSGADLTESLKQDIDADWQKFWSINGEKLIWESWIAKYSAYINPDYLQPTDKSEDTPKPEKFKFEEKEIHQFEKERHRLVRELSGSDDRLCQDVSEGWNPLSPASVECETEIERLLSSRCGSHASSSLRTVDSMTNVTRMTVSSLDLSSSSSSSDSFSSVSSMQSSISSEDSEEDNQHQWNLLWKKHYEEEYLQQYNKFVSCMIDSAHHTKTVQSNNSTTFLKGHSKHLLLHKKKLKDLHAESVQNSLAEKSFADLDRLLQDLNMSESDGVKEEEMAALGLPTAFGKAKKKFKEKSAPNKDFDSARDRVKSAFNLIGLDFDEGKSSAFSGQVDYKMKHIRLQNRHLKLRPEKPKHVYFDDDGNMVTDSSEQELEESTFPGVLDDDSDKLSSCDDDISVVQKEKVLVEEVEEHHPLPKRKKRKKKLNLPPEIKENAKLRKYWHKRFSLFSKFDEGVKLDEESWYSVTPEQVAKNAAKRCQCGVIVDAFCGAGGNAIQFAMTCQRVIAIDIDEKKVEIARNNAEVYGVADKIDFIVGDFFQLCKGLRADVVFLSPPWGGPSYLRQESYDLEEMLQPLPFSKLVEAARLVSDNFAVFLPRNSNTHALMVQAGPGKKVEIEQNFINKKLIALTAYYGQLIKEK